MYNNLPVIKRLPNTICFDEAAKYIKFPNKLSIKFCYAITHAITIKTCKLQFSILTQY